MSSDKKISLFICSLLILYFLINSWDSALIVPVNHVDGAYQTASSLFRIYHNQLPGRDFYPYLGLGPIYGIFPLFIVLGGKITSSLAATKLVCFLTAWLAVTAVYLFTFDDKKLTSAILFSGTLVVLIALFAVYLGPAKHINFLIEPGVSLRSIRSSLVYIVAIAFYLLRTKQASVFCYSLPLSLCFIWSNDFAFTTFLIMFTTLALASLFVAPPRKIIIDLCVTFIASVVLGFFWIYILTAGYPLEFELYNFRDVAKDQWWYFVPYSYGGRILSLTDIGQLFELPTLFSVFLIFALVIFALKRKSFSLLLLGSTGLSLLGGGLVASVGGHYGLHYFFALYCWSVITLGLFLWKFILIRYGIAEKLLTYTLVTINLSSVFFCLFQYSCHEREFSSDMNLIYSRELGGYISASYKEYLEFIHSNKNASFVEEYSGLWNAISHQNPLLKVDSVIHALGSVREVSESVLQNADFIITSNRLFTPYWQPWSFSMNLWFYKEVVLNRFPVFYSPSTVVWAKNKTAHTSYVREIPCMVQQKQVSVIGDFNDDKEQLVFLKLEYLQTQGKGRHLFIFENNISPASETFGEISLPPGANHAFFPVKVSKNDSTLKWKVLSRASVDYFITSCKAYHVSFDNDYVLSLSGSESEKKQDYLN